MSAGLAPATDPPQSRFEWQIATVGGIPVILEISALMTLILATYSYHLYLQTTESNWNLIQVWGTSLVMGLLLYASVLAHELGHSVIALRQGIPVRSIRLFLLGGLATIQRESRSVSGTIQLAVSGPLVSLAIAASFWILSHILPAWGTFPCARLAQLNGVLGAFNLCPILPLDGGHVLTALIWKLTGNRLTGVRTAAWLGKILGGAAIGIGLALMVTVEASPGPWTSLVGWFIFSNASRYHALAKLQKTLLSLKIGDLSPKTGQWLDGQMPVDAFVTTYLAASPISQSSYVMVNGDSSQAWLDLDALQALERSQWATTPISNFAKPVLELPADLPLNQAILQLDAQVPPNALVTNSSVESEAENTANPQWIDPSTILLAVGTALKLTLNPTDLEQARLTGTYPPTLNLKDVAQALEWFESPLPS
jgi:Zn-dependent protease